MKAVVTQRQLEILKMVADGMISKEIATKLNTTYLTVETHRYDIMIRLQAKNAANMIHIAHLKGIL